ACLCAKNKILRSAWPRSPAYPITDILRRERRTRTGAIYKIDRKRDNIIGHRNPADKILELGNLLTVENAAKFGTIHACGRFDDLKFLLHGRIIKPEIEHETIQLCFGKRVRSFLFN